MTILSRNIRTCKMSIYLLACRSEADEPMEEAVARGVIIVPSLVVREVVPKWRVGQFLVTLSCSSTRQCVSLWKSRCSEKRTCDEHRRTPTNHDDISSRRELELRGYDSNKGSSGTKRMPEVKGNIQHCHPREMSDYTR
jgi:hypothetical protein